jgi:tRNA G18 (ribose-2'-O)-methylase SpoU
LSDKKIFLILHNIRSLYNVGSIFRTADAAGVSRIYLTGYTPDPAQKTALGAEKFVAWERKKDLAKLVKILKMEKIQIVALEQDRKAVDYVKLKPKFPVALILGNEVHGLSPAILRKCAKIIFIPQYGKKESLNVAVAAGIALFELVRAFRK